EERSEASLEVNTLLLLLIITTELTAYKNKFPDLERFDGTRKNYLSWKFKYEGKLEYDVAMFLMEDSKVRYKLMLYISKNRSLKEYIDKVIELFNDLLRRPPRDCYSCGEPGYLARNYPNNV
ncbi:hypothetical protein COCSADRAFT_37628, partial [Bipolaris sorokiniana ND90Pr]